MRRVLVYALLSMAACVSEPIEWGATQYDAAPVPPLPTTTIVAVSGAKPCSASLRTARIFSATVAVWWDVRSDSSASLMVANSASPSAGWGPSLQVDSSDRSRRGCNRPPPAITTDPATGYVYIVYFAEPADGAGIFFVHSMDKGAMFHAPFPVLFGEKPARVAISAKGNRVVVAHEDPNSSTPRIAVALSKTEGHLFEERTDVSSGNVRAVEPVVSLFGDTIRVWWVEQRSGSAGTRIAYRAGRWK
ncbi:MAG TPA: hypothetical protein VM939_05630 [Gemmatimonadaceae bacterium]|nr:hypothetical protein [Gemmatimonadaceae bacterium]